MVYKWSLVSSSSFIKNKGLTAWIKPRSPPLSPPSHPSIIPQLPPDPNFITPKWKKMTLFSNRIQFLRVLKKLPLLLNKVIFSTNTNIIIFWYGVQHTHFDIQDFYFDHLKCMVGPAHGGDVAELRDGPEDYGEVDHAHYWLRLANWTKPNLLRPQKSNFLGILTSFRVTSWDTFFSYKVNWGRFLWGYSP